MGEQKRSQIDRENPPHQLDSYLAELYISIRTVNTKKYEPLMVLKTALSDKQY